MTNPKLRHRATVNMLRMGHCAPSITRTFNRLTNRGHELAEWLAHEFGSASCRDITRCDFVKTEDVERYVAHGCVRRCRSIAAAVARKVEERCHS